MDTALLETFRLRYPFALDPFQEEAISYILEGDSVIVSAPTGAGKTLIAEFAIYKALATGRRIAYTTPLKALSNQKFADFCKQYGEEFVGILTGDVKINPSVPLVVMTTEILRNKLYTHSLEDIAYVVLDECHYMGDEGRGTVWEEIIINCPREIQLIALSATVGNIDEIAEWISGVHRPIRTVVHQWRPVPLHYYLCGPEAEMVEVDGRSRAQVYQAVSSWRGVPRVRMRGRQDRDRRPRLVRRRVSPLALVPTLKGRGWLPAIYFIFSRAGCEEALRRLLEEGFSLLDSKQQGEVDEAIATFVSENPTLVSKSELNALIFEGLRRGTGAHHAGILPALKRLTETLFERGLIQVVFATETMSLGIHMPAKSVVIQTLTKRSDVGFRTLSHNELTQMAGRAGRRGIDPEGKCVIGLDGPDAVEETLHLLRKQSEPIESRFRIGYSSAALLLLTHRDPQDIRRNIESSFGQFQNRKRIRAIEEQLKELRERLEEGRRVNLPCCTVEELLAYQEKRQEVEALRQELHQLRIAEGPVARRRRRRGHLHRREEEGKAVPVQDYLAAKRRVEEKAAALGALSCHSCPERRRLEKLLKRERRLRETIRTQMETLEHLQNTYWEQFLRVVEVLKHFNCLRNGALSTQGMLVASLRHDNELLVTQVVFSGVLSGLKAHEMMAVLSCLVEEPRETEAHFARQLLKRERHLRDRIRHMEMLAREVMDVQRAHRVFLPVSLHTTYLAAAYEWAAGEEDWLCLVESQYEGHEGDLIRAFRRLIDLSRQLLESSELPPALRDDLRAGVRALDRGIVLESALI
ncbi:MAG TPA: DEAD/DEAH box helicase [Candidatus Methylomirabilis sp.]|nr:DEAD/DEAH box helicase [Candidatus Methylomirabilis sp.]